MTPVITDPVVAPAGAPEELTLGGLEVNTSPFCVEVFDHKPAKKLLEWVKGADADGAKLLRMARHENAEITVRLRVEQQVNMDTALVRLGQIIDRLQEAERLSANGGRGLELTWSPAGSTFTGTFYVLAGEVEDIPKVVEGADAGWFVRFPSITIRLSCDPFIYGDETTTATTTSNLPLVTMLVTDVPGDVPAEARITITDGATQSRDYVAVGLQNLSYDVGTTLLADSSTFITAGFAGSSTTRAGSYSTNVIRATLSTSPVVVCSSPELAHLGTYRNLFRLWPSSTNVSARLVWRQGRDQWTAEPWAVAPFEDNFWEADLGQSKIRAAPLGTQTWQWRIEAKSTAAGDTLDVDYHALVPSGEGYGKARRTLAFETPNTFLARDEFDQTPGTPLTGLTLPVGGTWAEAGDTTDPQTSIDHTLERSASSDTDNRWDIAGTTTATNIAVQADIYTATANTVASQGVFARYTDISNYLAAYVTGAGSGSTLALHYEVAGVLTTLKILSVTRLAATWYTLRLLVDTRGIVRVWLYPRNGGPVAPVVTEYSSALATGGGLATGKFGVFDYNGQPTGVTRSYDNFLAFAPTADAAVFSGQSLEFRSYGDDPVLREDSTGVYWGRPAESRGGRLWLPPAGDEGRTTRLAVLARRADIETQPSSNVADSTSVAVSYRPRWLAIPRQA